MVRLFQVPDIMASVFPSVILALTALLYFWILYRECLISSSSVIIRVVSSAHVTSILISFLLNG